MAARTKAISREIIITVVAGSILLFLATRPSSNPLEESGMTSQESVVEVPLAEMAWAEELGDAGGVESVLAEDFPEPEPIIIDRLEFLKRVVVEYPSILLHVDILPAVDDDGEVIGLTATDFDQYRIVQEVGLRDDDILVTLNGGVVDSMEAFEEIFRQYATAREFRAGLLRDGEPIELVYRVKN